MNESASLAIAGCGCDAVAGRERECSTTGLKGCVVGMWMLEKGGAMGEVGEGGGVTVREGLDAPVRLSLLPRVPRQPGRRDL